MAAAEDVWAGMDAANGYSLPAEVTAGIDPARFFKRYDMAQLHRDGVPPAELICSSLLYAGGLHSVAGPPDCGKSTFMCWAALAVIREGGEFMLMDEESGPDQYAEKMIALGATAEDMEHLHYFPFSGVVWSAVEIAAFLAMAHDTRPKAIAWDSSAAFMARAGLDENNASDVTRFWSQVLTPCARDVKAAVIVADHVAKNSTESRYARGSGAKLAATDVAYRMDAVTPFSRTQAGTVKLNVSKDRRGWLHRWHEMRLTPHSAGAHLEIVIEATQPVLADNAPPIQQALMKCLTTQPESRSYLHNLVTREMHARPARETVSRALNELADKGLVTRLDMGPGKEAYWSLAAPSPKPPPAPEPAAEAPAPASEQLHL